jgi:hypothetical protein
VSAVRIKRVLSAFAHHSACHVNERVTAIENLVRSNVQMVRMKRVSAVRMKRVSAVRMFPKRFAIECNDFSTIS